MSERFWAKVSKTGECWLWTGALARGRPHCRHDGRTMPGRKAAWVITHGPVPEGAVVRGTCGNPLCVRPDHLEMYDSPVSMDLWRLPWLIGALEAFMDNVDDDDLTEPAEPTG